MQVETAKLAALFGVPSPETASTGAVELAIDEFKADAAEQALDDAFDRAFGIEAGQSRDERGRFVSVPEQPTAAQTRREHGPLEPTGEPSDVLCCKFGNALIGPGW